MDQKRINEMMKDPEVRELAKSLIDQFVQRGKKEQDKKLQNFRDLNETAFKGQILFTGSSLMEQFPITEFWQEAGLKGIVYNRGIGGYTSDDFVKAIDAQLLDLKPRHVFLNIGTNDMRPWPDGRDYEKMILGNYETILSRLKEELPNTGVTILAFYPVNPDVAGRDMMGKGMTEVRTNENLKKMNVLLEKTAQKYGCDFLDVSEGLRDENGQLKEEFTPDGVHMYAGPYRIVFNNLLPYLKKITGTE